MLSASAIDMPSLLRGLAERLLRDRTCLRRMPAEFGGVPIMGSSAGGLRYLLKSMANVDPELLANARALVRPGNTVWDIGANVGLFSVAAAALSGNSGKVFAFEPDTTLVDLLRRTASLQPNTSAPITIVPSGMASQTGLRTFRIARRARASNALSNYGHSQMGGCREEQTIVCLSIDDCLGWLTRPDVLKIDVEGAEIEVLHGATTLLTDSRPVVVCEVGPSNRIEATELLRSKGYALFDASRMLCREHEIEEAVWSTIALPADEMSTWIAL